MALTGPMTSRINVNLTSFLEWEPIIKIALREISRQYLIWLELCSFTLLCTDHKLLLPTYGPLLLIKLFIFGTIFQTLRLNLVQLNYSLKPSFITIIIFRTFMYLAVLSMFLTLNYKMPRNCPNGIVEVGEQLILATAVNTLIMSIWFSILRQGRILLNIISSLMTLFQQYTQMELSMLTYGTLLLLLISSYMMMWRVPS
jgi:hypothetical protein